MGDLEGEERSVLGTKEGASRYERLGAFSDKMGDVVGHSQTLGGVIEQ